MSKTYRSETKEKAPRQKESNERHKLHQILQTIRDPEDADELEIELDEYLHRRRE